jgi:ribonuclease R
MLVEKIMEIIGQHKKNPLTVDELADVLGIERNDRKILIKTVERLVKDASLVQTKKDKLALPEGSLGKK